MTQRIIWLASYPKSGNTWVRVFLTNYQRRAEHPADINDLDGAPIASSRLLFDEWAGVEAADLTADEIASYRPEVYRRIADDSPEPVVMKVHDAFTGPDGATLFPGDATRSAIYVIRNPLDVAVSFAHYQGWTIDRTVDALCNGYVMAPHGGRLSDQLEQTLGSWTEHVSSWTEQQQLPVHTTRYEDLLAEPEAAFATLVAAAGFPVDPAWISRAAAQSQFSELRSQEQSRGFNERPIRSSAFFRQGRAGGWKQELTDDQVQRVIAHCGGLMTRYGYLDDAGRPT